MKSLKALIVCVAVFFLAFNASAQQITKFGVVDTSRVYQAYYRNSAPMRR